MSSFPRLLTGLSNVISASAGSAHVAALKSDGRVWAWGQNGSGQLGDGTNTDRGVPTLVPSLSNVMAVAAGGFHTLALLPDGTVMAWGENYYGQLGSGDNVNVSAPIVVTGLTNVRKIAAGYERSIALKEDGTVWTWGYGYYDLQTGQDHYQLTPTLVEGLTDVMDIAAGFEHAVALKSDGTVWVWGNNFNHELGDGGPISEVQVAPIQVAALSNIVALASAYDHTLALSGDGTVWAWGANYDGQLGVGSSSPHSTPVQVSGLANVASIAAAQWYSMAMQTDGTVWSWGNGGSNLGVVGYNWSLLPEQTVLGVVDNNNNSMDDRWELDYFGNLDQTAAGDFDGDGISNLAEFLARTDPINYYDGGLPVLSIVSGDNQTADPETFLPEPLVVQVNDVNGQPLRNAPVIFTPSDWFIGVSPDPNAVDSTVTARTDVNGRAVAYDLMPPWPGEVVTITATAQSGTSSVSVQFTATVNTPPPPAAPSDVTAQRQADGSTLVTWISHSTNEDGFVIRRQNLDQSWSTLAFANAGATSAVIPPPTQPVADTRDYEVGAYVFTYTNANYSQETNPATVRYAIIDLGQANPFRVTNSGYVLLSGWYPLHGAQRWFQGQLENLVGGDDPLLTGGMDINENGTVVGTILGGSFTNPSPLNGNAPLPPPAWYSGVGSLRLAARWDAGQTDASLITSPTFSFAIDASPDSRFTGPIGGSYAYTIDNDGQTFGLAFVGYQENAAYYDPEGSFHGTQWGTLVSGYNFTSGTPLGNQSLVLGPGGFTTQGQARYVLQARNGITLGSDTQFPYDPVQRYINDVPVPFRPVNLNGFGMVLCRDDALNWFIYDTGTAQVTKDLEIPHLYSYFLPQALNHRQIPAYDANGQPILDGSGQQVMKESPQVVGTDSSFDAFTHDAGSIATIWEENPLSGHYEMQYLNRLINPDSGWDLYVARDINDSGVIAADGWYQAYDSNRNPVGDRQWRACLLLPVQVKQLNYPTSSGTTDMGPVQEKVIAADQIAYITGTPQMPQLQATLGGGSISGLVVEWRMTVTSERTERGTKDDLTIPATTDPKVVPLGIDQPWLISNYYIPPADFFGGSCTIYYRIKNSAGAYLTDEQAFSFKIRGKNPKDADAKAYIQSTEGSYRFAWAMVQHESRQTVDGVDRVYNQFNAGGSLKELPYFSGNYPTEDGWGIAQLDRPLDVSAATAEVYSWKQNLAKFYEELAVKEATQQRFFDAVAAAYSTDPEAQSPPSNFVPPGTVTTLTALEAGTITLYNGAEGCPISRYAGTTYQNPWTFNSSGTTGQKWQYHPNTNDYLYKVIYNEFEPNHLGYQE